MILIEPTIVAALARWKKHDAARVPGYNCWLAMVDRQADNSDKLESQTVTALYHWSCNMQITDVLAQMGGIQSMANELGISEAQAKSGAAALLPSILGGFKKQSQSQAVGLDGLVGLLGKLGGGSLLDDVLSPAPTNTGRGDDVLGQIFGSKDVSRTVARNAGAQTGLDPALLKKMLPVLAMLVTGLMAKQHAGGSSSGGSAGGLGGMLGGMLGGKGVGSGTSAGGWASMLDLDGDGNPLDDILGMASKALR